MEKARGRVGKRKEITRDKRGTWEWGRGRDASEGEFGVERGLGGLTTFTQEFFR